MHGGLRRLWRSPLYCAGNFRATKAGMMSSVTVSDQNEILVTYVFFYAQGPAQPGADKLHNLGSPLLSFPTPRKDPGGPRVGTRTN